MLDDATRCIVHEIVRIHSTHVYITDLCITWEYVGTVHVNERQLQCLSSEWKLFRIRRRQISLSMIIVYNLHVYEAD